MRVVSPRRKTLRKGSPRRRGLPRSGFERRPSRWAADWASREDSGDTVSCSVKGLLAISLVAELALRWRPLVGTNLPDVGRGSSRGRHGMMAGTSQSAYSWMAARCCSCTLHRSSCSRVTCGAPPEHDCGENMAQRLIDGKYSEVPRIKRRRKMQEPGFVRVGSTVTTPDPSRAHTNGGQALSICRHTSLRYPPPSRNPTAKFRSLPTLLHRDPLHHDDC
jgi:hypothetical protein